MLSSKILNSKASFIKKTGETIVDLVARTFNRKDVNLDDVQIFEVDEFTEMRPDLISNSVYLNIFMWDALLKFNGISNPFAIKAKDIFYIPKQEELGKAFNNSPTIIDKGVRSQLSNQVLNAITVFDKNRLASLSVKPLPNNIVDTSDKNVKIRDGKVIFGEDVTTINKERCKGSVSRAKLKEKLIQNQIFS